MRSDWSIEEVTLIVSDYFDMLTKQLSGINYVKSEHRRKVSRLLKNRRSEGSIEFKHQNISSILIELGMPYIPGYKARGNYQQLLKESVEKYVYAHPELDELINRYISTDNLLPKIDDLMTIEVEVPELNFIVNEPVLKFGEKNSINYFEREIRNKKLGLLGEEFIMNYEKQRMCMLGFNSLVNKIEHISQTQGDYAGFDILSYDEEGKEKYIEVKTTKLGMEAPFYFTRNELAFSKYKDEKYRLYRLFNFKTKPKFYQLKGSLNETCDSISTEFMGWPK